MLSPNQALTLGPDGYSRFFVIARVLQELYQASDAKLKILDVGGCSPFLAQVLDVSEIKYELTILDILPKPKGMNKNYIHADVTQTKLPDGAYDVVVTTDTLEHVPKQDKDEFVRACVRLSKQVCIIAAPYNTESTDEAEVLVNAFNKKLFGSGQNWLEEHFEFGKPTVERVSGILDGLGVTYQHFGTNNLYSWLLSSHLNLIEAKIGIDTKLSQASRHAYNLNLAKSVEFDEPSYRHFFVIAKDKNRLNKDLLTCIKEPTEPHVYLEYIHVMMQAVAYRMEALKDQTENQAHKLYSLKQELAADKIEHERTKTRLAEAEQSAERLAKQLLPFTPLIQVAKKIHSLGKRKGK